MSENTIPNLTIKAGGPFTKPTKAENTASPLPEPETMPDPDAMREILLDAAIRAVLAEADKYMQECEAKRQVVEELRQRCGGKLPAEIATYLTDLGARRAAWRKARVAVVNAVNAQMPQGVRP